MAYDAGYQAQMQQRPYNGPAAARPVNRSYPQGPPPQQQQQQQQQRPPPDQMRRQQYDHGNGYSNDNGYGPDAGYDEGPWDSGHYDASGRDGQNYGQYQHHQNQPPNHGGGPRQAPPGSNFYNGPAGPPRTQGGMPQERSMTMPGRPQGDGWGGYNEGGGPGRGYAPGGGGRPGPGPGGTAGDGS
jgi:hypothetical protein